LIFAGILRGSASNFDLSGGACGRGRCGAEGRFLKKAPQKLFWALRGARYGDSEVILVFLSLARGKRRPSHSTRKGKLVFLSLYYGLG
jgi:hypothetical protein